MEAGGIRVNSNGHEIARSDTVFLMKKWNTVRYTIRHSNPNKAISISINDHHIELDHDHFEARCKKMKGKGAKDYYIVKIGLYEDDVRAGYTVYYKDLRLRRI